MIVLTVNGRQVELGGPTPLLDYVESLGVDWRAIAVELNDEILQREQYPATVLNAADRVEIVRMVGGGKLSTKTWKATEVTKSVK